MSKFQYCNSAGVLGTFEGIKLCHMRDGIVEVLDDVGRTVAIVFLKPGESIAKE